MDSQLASNDRVDFRDRLLLALERAGVAASPTILAREFNVRADGAAVTVHAARKWLVGEAYPTQARLTVLSRWLAVSAQWLRFGEGPPESTQAANKGANIPHEEVILLGDYRRLDERSQAVIRDMVGSMLRHHSLRK